MRHAVAEADIHSYMTKPFFIDELIERIKQLLSTNWSMKERMLNAETIRRNNVYHLYQLSTLFRTRIRGRSILFLSIPLYAAASAGMQAHAPGETGLSGDHCKTANAEHPYQEVDLPVVMVSCDTIARYIRADCYYLELACNRFHVTTVISSILMGRST